MTREERSPTPSVLGVLAQIARSGEVPGLAPRAREDALAQAAAQALDSRDLGGGAVERDDVTLAWELARLAPAPRACEAFGLALAVLEAARRGSTRLSWPGEAPRATSGAAEVSTALPGGQLELPFSGGSRREGAPRAPLVDLLAPLVGPWSDPRAPLVHEAGCIALRHWAATERAIAGDLARRVPEARARERARGLVSALRSSPLPGPRGPMQLTEEQEEGVVAMLSERTVVLTGGPGTGKTSVVVSLLRALAHRAHEEAGLGRVEDEVRLVALAAPTGKAADRLGDAVRSALSRSADPIDAAVQRCLASPTTIHRLLGYRRGLDRSGGGGFRANRANPLAHRLVLVDEVSMVDTALFARLLSAVAPEATLVLLGDPDQLPSVDPGAVLRDLVRARPRGVAVHSLSRSHRMDPTDPDGAHVLGVARACLDPETGRVPFRTLGADAAAADAPVGRGGAWHLEAVELPRVLDAWIARHLLVESLGRLERLDTGDTGAHDAGGTHAPAEVREALEQLARGRILTVTRRSAEDLDAYVSASFARWRGEPARARRVLPGEPVMVIHNDYDEDLWNGDSGVAWRDARGEMHVSFRRGPSFRTRPLAAVAHLIERSHAVTVHKAQGSEHDEVLLVLPPVDTPLSSREIVYTAITRARRSAIVVGRSELLAGALARSSARQTGLVEALAQLDAGGSREREGTHQPAGAA
jgi:exodeoxyribonuclease V alpha subunit